MALHPDPHPCQPYHLWQAYYQGKGVMGSNCQLNRPMAYGGVANYAPDSDFSGVDAVVKLM